MAPFAQKRMTEALRALRNHKTTVGELRAFRQRQRKFHAELWECCKREHEAQYWQCVVDQLNQDGR